MLLMLLLYAAIRWFQPKRTLRFIELMNVSSGTHYRMDVSKECIEWKTMIHYHFTTPNTTTTCVPSFFCSRSRSTSEVVVRRALGLITRSAETARNLTTTLRETTSEKNIGRCFLQGQGNTLGSHHYYYYYYYYYSSYYYYYCYYYYQYYCYSC